MPLKQGSSKAIIEANIKELIEAGHKPDQAAAIAYKEAGVSKDEYEAMDVAMDRREYNQFGWMTVEGNPITKVGVFPYLGRQIGAPEPDRVYMVYRPEEELNNPETIESFKLTPFINEHPTSLLGNADGLVATDKKRVEGVFGEKVYFEYPYLKANLRIYSEQALESIDLGKEELSVGYLCRWSRENGVFEGQEYHYVQRDIRGNHGALVDEGRSGPDVSVMDSMTFNLDSKEQQMSAEILKAVADLTVAMDSKFAAIEKRFTAMDESAKEDEKEVEKDDKAMDEDEDKEDSEKAMDEDKESKEDKMGEGMDSAAFKKAVAAEVKKQLSAKPAAMDSAAIMADIAKKTDLVARVTPIIGTFACDSMTHVQVAEYAAEKLGLDKSHAVVAVDSYLKARPAVQAAYGMDNADVKQSSGAAFLAEQLK